MMYIRYNVFILGIQKCNILCANVVLYCVGRVYLLILFHLWIFANCEGKQMYSINFQVYFEYRGEWFIFLQKLPTIFYIFWVIFNVKDLIRRWKEKRGRNLIQIDRKDKSWKIFCLDLILDESLIIYCNNVIKRTWSIKII